MKNNELYNNKKFSDYYIYDSRDSNFKIYLHKIMLLKIEFFKNLFDEQNNKTLDIYSKYDIAKAGFLQNTIIIYFSTVYDISSFSSNNEGKYLYIKGILKIHMYIN